MRGNNDISTLEFEALQMIYSEGGDSDVDKLSKKMGIEPNRAKMLCFSIAQKDYIDYMIGGEIQITPKGTLEILRGGNREKESSKQ